MVIWFAAECDFRNGVQRKHSIRARKRFKGDGSLDENNTSRIR